MGQHLAKNTTKRNKRQAEVRDIYATYMKQYDASHTGTLSRDEVRNLATDLLNTYSPLVGGLTEEDIDMIMRCGGHNVQNEISAAELPEAVGIMVNVRDMNQAYHELFQRFDTDSTGELPADQLRDLLTFVNSDDTIMDSDVDYILKQLEPRNKTDPVKEDQLKAALACWYTLHPPVSDQVKTVFKSWDTAGTGVISKREFVVAMLKIRPTFQEYELEKLFNGADRSGTGSLDYQEFVDFLWGDAA